MAILHHFDSFAGLVPAAVGPSGSGRVVDLRCAASADRPVRQCVQKTVFDPRHALHAEVPPLPPQPVHARVPLALMGWCFPHVGHTPLPFDTPRRVLTLYVLPVPLQVGHVEYVL